jgi:hypothetical protein
LFGFRDKRGKRRTKERVGGGGGGGAGGKKRKKGGRIISHIKTSKKSKLVNGTL